MKKYRCILILAFAFLVVCPACALSGSNRQTSSIATVVAETQIAQIVEATEQARQSLPITATGTSVPALLPTSLPTQPAEPTETHPIVPEPQVTLIPPENPYAPAFASYPVTKVTLPAAYQGGYTLPVNLAKVKGLDLVTLSPSQTQYLSANGFVVNPPEAGKYREFYQVYEAQRYAVEQPIFITTDAVLHIYHLLFDKLLRDLEREQFDDSVKSLTSAMVKATQAQYQAVKNTALAEPARRNLAFFGVAAQLLGMPDAIPAAAQDLVAAELSLINAHSGADISPIWDRDDLPDDKKLIEDYSQYIPRGHYTRDETLQRYFRAMMWYGRLTFRAQDAFETRRALLLVQALRDNQTADGQTAANVWKDLFEPITFIVGKADDLTYYEYSALMDQAFGLQATPQALLDDAKLAAFVAGVRQLPAPQVNSMWVWIWQDKKEVTQGYRFMGQRFTLDAYVFGQLIWRNVGTEQDPRYLPKGLDFMAALGSEEAYSILAEMGETRYTKYDSQMTKVRQEISALGLDSWTQNLYWSWLYAFQPLLSVKKEPFPAFMQTQAWSRKELNTALGSWTELKHDTLLYAKQVMAEMGGGGPQEPPHGYVEPNPEVYARLSGLAQMTLDGLELRGLLNDQMQGSLENLLDLLNFLKTTSERLLAGEQLSTDNYWRIQYFGGELEALTLAASDCMEGDVGMCRDLSDQKAALVADVATGLSANGALSALEEAVGQPTQIYVILPDQPWRIGVGVVFTYYEFVVPVDQRMTDEQWQAQVESGMAPLLPDWTRLFITP